MYAKFSLACQASEVDIEVDSKETLGKATETAGTRKKLGARARQRFSTCILLSDATKYIRL